MKIKLGRAVALVCAIAMCAVWASAQMSEGKEKPPMYSYVSFWTIPRAQWAEMEKADAADEAILQKGLSGGSIIGSGADRNLVHQPDGDTHDEWWSAMSMAGILNVLDQFYKTGNATTPVLSTSTKHWDSIYVTRYYNWHSGSWKDVYTRSSLYALKESAPDDTLDTLSKNVLVPFFEKLLADGAIHEYEIDTEAVHTENPNDFWIVYIAANAEALDKVDAALRESLKANPLIGPAFDSMVDFSHHRDYLSRTTATYK